MRTKLFLKNSVIILITKFLYYLSDFACRTILIHTLPIEYVGISGLFNNILTILSLSDLGFGTVLVYSMYVPIAQHDENKLLALVSFYKKAYRLVAIFIATIGLCLSPFLSYLIKDCPDIPYLHVFYLLYLGNTVSSYLFTYNQSLYLADQKMYVTSFYNNIANIIRIILQIILLITTHNFLLYLCVQMPTTLFINYYLTKKAKRDYPFLSCQTPPSLLKEERKKILKDVFATFNHRVGFISLNFTDNLLISFFFGIVMVSKNDSYNMILTFLRNIFSPVFSALNAGIGNFHATKTPEETLKLFGTLHFASFWFYTFCTTAFLALINPFITLVWGKKLLFEFPVVLLISINFFITGIRQMPITFKESLGLLYQDRYKPLLEALIKIVLSLILLKQFGIIGIFIGTFISMISTSLWVEPYVLFHYGFRTSTKQFWERNIRYIFSATIIIALTAFCVLQINLPLLPCILVRFIICLLLPNLLLLLFYHRSEEFKELLGIVQGIIHNWKQKRN